MKRNALTDVAVRHAKPREKQYRLFDGQGLALEVTPQGSKRWRFIYRFGGRGKMLSLGCYPAVGLSEAREKCLELRKLVAQGIDPSDVRKAEAKARQRAIQNSFEKVAFEWVERHRHLWSEGHLKVTQQRLASYILPHLGGHPIGDISSQQVLDLLKFLEEKGTRETAKRVKIILGQIWRYAVVTGRCQYDIVAPLKGAIAPSKSEHFAAITDPMLLAAVLKLFESYQGSPVVRAALRIAPYLFVRPNELRHMRWGDIDPRAKEWRFILSKTKQPHIVPLAPTVWVLLAELEQWECEHQCRGEYVFPGRAGRPISDGTLMAAIKSMGLGQITTVHGFRATARTLLDEVLGYRPDLIEAQLGHTVRDPLGRAYNRTSFLKERREMMAVWADYLDSLKAL